MISPRSFLVSRQTQKNNARASPSSSASTPLSSPPLSPSTSSDSAWRKDAAEPYLLSSHATYPHDSTTATTQMAVSARPSVRPTRESQLPSPPSSPPNNGRPSTPTSPVRIPTKPRKNVAYFPSQRDHRHHDARRHRSSSSSPRWRDTNSPDAIPASVAALLAVTSIPPPRRSTRQRSAKAREEPMTVDTILYGQTEKELSFNFIKGPLDVLLSPPDDLEDDTLSIGESTVASPSSMSRTVSCGSLPSLSDSLSADSLSPLESPASAYRGRKVRPTRRSLTPVSSPPGQREEHPLYRHDTDTEDLNFAAFDASPEDEETKGSRMFGPFRSAFKSNLTASLRALRNAARSFSTMNMSSVPAEDFLTRSILTLEPNVPFTDERMPPTLDEEPSAAMRRYLNPTQTARLESQGSSKTASPQGAFTASIQMQTYKVHRSRSASPNARASRSYGDQSARGKEALVGFPPGPRQREMRENSDFIRVAVMEMAMRKNGKLDEQRPGRARWALPPRKTSAKPYEIGTDGIPVRWVAITS